MIGFEREGPSPMELLQRLLAADPEFLRLEEERGAVVAVPAAKTLGALVRPVAEADPDELIRSRFLCRGGSAVLVGPTGVGKSSLTMQTAILWALGRPCFRLTPARPLRVLIVQAENDEGDMAEMRDGVFGGLALPEAQRREAESRIVVVTEDAKTREAFAAFLDNVLQHYPSDLVIADPAFAYIGGDASSQRDVSPFLRNMLNPVIHKHRVGFLLVHHVNKPPQGEQKSQWQAGDYAYLGSGSAEFANWARAVIAIRSIGSDSVFELLLAKRGRRAGWLDEMGRPSNSRFIAYHREPGVICWRDAEPEEVEPFRTGAKAITVQTVVDLIAGGAKTKNELVAALVERFSVKKTKAYKAVEDAMAAGAIREGSGGKNNAKPLTITGKVPPRRSVEDTDDEKDT